MRSIFGGNGAGAIRPAIFPLSRNVPCRASRAGARAASLVAIVAAIVCGSPAQAARVVATITGVTENGTDFTGVFGFAPGGSMGGHSFRLVYTIDDTRGQQGIYTNGGRVSGSYIANSGLDSPMTAVLTINGHSVSYGTLPVDSVTSYFTKDLTNQGPAYFNYHTQVSETYNVGNSHGGGSVFVYFGDPSQDYHWAAGIDVAPDGGSNAEAFLQSYDTDSKGNKSNYRFFHVFLDPTHFEIPGPRPIAKNLGIPGKDCGCADGAPNCLAGNPINAATGNKLEIETDFAGAAVTGLDLTRYYNSQDTTRSPFGVGWRSAWHRSLNPVSATVAVVTRADGRQDAFNLAAGVWWPDPDVTSRLIAVTSAGTQTGWQLLTEDDTTESYALDGRLISITSRAGLATTLGYNAAGQLTAVTGPFGHKLGFVENAAGRVTKMTPPDGGVFAYAYDGGGNLVSVTHPDGGVRRYVYGDASFPHALTGIVDENGAAFASWAYDAKGRAVSSQHAGGVELTTVAYNADGSSTVTDARGNAHSYALTTQFGMVKPTALTGAPYPAAGGKAFTYDSNGFVASRTDFDGNVTTYEHDARGNETFRVEAAGTPLAREVATAWLANFHLPHEINENDERVITFGYDAKGNLLEKTATDERITRSWTYTYDTNGQVLTATDPLGHVTTYTYDAKGDLATVTDALGHVTKFTGYDADGRPTSLTDPNGLTTTLTYNFRGEPTSRDVGGELTTYTYDRAGQLTRTTRPDGSFLTFTHDAAHRLTGARDALGNRVAYTRDAASNLTKVRFFDPTGTLTRVRSFSYDSANRVARSIGAAGETTLYAHDPNGNPTKVTDPLGHATSYAYDALSRLAQATDPDGGVIAEAFDALDHLTAVTDPRGLVTGYTWDGLDDQTAVRSPDSGASARTFDAAGNVATSTDARRLTTTYAYDALNRPVSAIYADGKTVTWHYDQGSNGIGHLTRMTDRSGSTLWTYDRHGRVLTKKQTTAGHTFTTAMSYDAAGRLATLTYPSGAAVTLSYDAAGRISGLKSGATGLASGVGYLPFGPATGWAQGNGADYSRSFDTDGRIAAIGLGTGTMTFAYDKASRITGIGETGFAAKNFGYDALDRLTGYTGGAITQTYKYDADGNRTSLAAGATTTYAIDAASNRLDSSTGAATRTLSYDFAGNMTTDNRVVTMLGYTYDASGRLVTAKTGAFTTTYSNDGLGERVSRAGYGAHGIPGGKEAFVYDEAGHLLGEYDGTGKAIEETVWLGSLPVAVLIPGKSPFYIAPDQLGAPHQIANAARATVWHWDHDPFGNGAPTGSLAYNLRFPGQYFDKETGLHQNGFRDYDPTTGRYVQSDPIGLAGGMNTYAYVGGNPLSNSDRGGLSCDDPYPTSALYCIKFPNGKTQLVWLGPQGWTNVRPPLEYDPSFNDPPDKENRATFHGDENGLVATSTTPRGLCEGILIWVRQLVKGIDDPSAYYITYSISAKTDPHDGKKLIEDNPPPPPPPPPPQSK